MAPKFDNVQPGDQLEMTAERRDRYMGEKSERDPSRVVSIAVVTHRWLDPVEDKEYVGIADVLKGGVYGKPNAKHTIRGLASQGWRPATRDWIAWAKERDAAVEQGKVVSLYKRK